ncbi:hypothetical protein CKA32_000265 [Geitlerinema sp. FC II]|nr:hypothetical protein CKA32_000265 [Geitlerinema sp. FC II]
MIFSKIFLFCQSQNKDINSQPFNSSGASQFCKNMRIGG